MVKVNQMAGGMVITFNDPLDVGLFLEQNSSDIVLELKNEEAEALLGQLLAVFKVHLGAAHVINLATALRTQTGIVQEMHDMPKAACCTEGCMACHALEESDSVVILQAYDDAMRVGR